MFSHPNMQHVAQIEGLQTNILSHIPQHLCLMAQVSKDWITPSRNQASSVIMQKSDEFITTLNTWSSDRKKLKADWKRYRQDAFLNRALGAREWGATPDVSSNKASRAIQDLLSTNKRYQPSSRFKHRHEDYLDLCSRLSLLKVQPKKDGTGFLICYSHVVYNRAERLFRTLHKLMCMREDLFRLFNLVSPTTGMKQRCSFIKATRPDLMIQRLSVLTDYLQKT